MNHAWYNKQWSNNYCSIFPTFRNRRNRESTILKAIENGTHSLFDIVASTYSNVDRILWIPASSNVRLHVDHLACQDKLPKVESSHALGTMLRDIYMHTNSCSHFQMLKRCGNVTPAQSHRKRFFGQKLQIICL